MVSPLQTEQILDAKLAGSKVQYDILWNKKQNTLIFKRYEIDVRRSWWSGSCYNLLKNMYHQSFLFLRRYKMSGRILDFKQCNTLRNK